MIERRRAPLEPPPPLLGRFRRPSEISFFNELLLIVARRHVARATLAQQSSSQWLALN